MNTVHGHMRLPASVLPFTISKNQSTITFLYSLYSATPCFLIIDSFSLLFNLIEYVYFSISFLLNLFNIERLFGTVALRSTLSILSVRPTVYLPLLCGYCLPSYTMYASILIFQVTGSRWGGGIVVCSICLYFNSFIFLANITLSPEVIKLEQTRTEHRPQLPAALMHVTPIRTKSFP